MKIIIGVVFFFLTNPAFSIEEITPYKFSDIEYEKGFAEYAIPESAIFSTARSQKNAPDVTYYFSKPKNCTEFPIAIFCTGSSSRESISSVIHVHRYFLKEFVDLGVGLITLEQWGISGGKIDVDDFMRHYTRTQRLMDHISVIECLLKKPPLGWNGKLIFVGVSEGGPLVTALTTKYSHITIATVNWSGAGDWVWREELWSFLEGMRNEMVSSLPWYIKLRSYLPRWFPYSISLYLPKTRMEYDAVMDKTLEDPSPDKELMGMTYMYHADSLNWPRVYYEGINSPYLAVAGVKDTLIKSSDAFVEKAKKAGANITYFRIPDMDHYVRKRPDILHESFRWLKEQCIQQSQP